MAAVAAMAPTPLNSHSPVGPLTSKWFCFKEAFIYAFFVFQGTITLSRKMVQKVLFKKCLAHTVCMPI